MSTLEQQQTLLAALFELGRPNFPPMHLAFDGLTKGEFFILNLIYDHGRQNPEAEGMYVSELLRATHATPPAVSRMLRGMEEKGYVERVVDRSDRRTTYIVLTAQGIALRKEAERRALDFTGRVIDQMGMADIEQLLSLWRRMRDIVQQELAKER